VPTQDRIEDLKNICQQRKEQLQYIEKRRDQLTRWQSGGLSLGEDEGEDLFLTLINDTDSTIQRYKKVLITMESLRNRAIAGEDV